MLAVAFSYGAYGEWNICKEVSRRYGKCTNGCLHALNSQDLFTLLFLSRKKSLTTDYTARPFMVRYGRISGVYGDGRAPRLLVCRGLPFQASAWLVSRIFQANCTVLGDIFVARSGEWICRT